MRILKKDLKHGTIKFSPQTSEDLWYLKRIISKGDFVTARTVRKSKREGDKKAELRHLVLKVEVEEVEFSRHANILRIRGLIKEGRPEKYISFGSYHTIEIKLNDSFTLEKEWKSYDLALVDEAVSSSIKPTILIVSMDSEQCVFGLVKPAGISIEGERESGLSGRQGDSERDSLKKKYFSEICGKLVRYDVPRILLAGPGFAKDEFLNYTEQNFPRLKEKIRTVDSSSATRSGIFEVIRRGEVEKAIGETKLALENSLMEKALAELGKESGLLVYGKKEVAKAQDYGAVETLMVNDTLIRTDSDVEKIAAKADKARGKVVIFDSEGDPGKKLAGIGGIAALLRFRIS